MRKVRGAPMTAGEAQSPPAEAGDAVDPPETGPGLRRDDDRRVIAGVCAGLGAYTGVDPVLWRTGFALTAFAGGTGLLLYVAAWMLMRDPRADRPRSSRCWTGPSRPGPSPACWPWG